MAKNTVIGVLLGLSCLAPGFVVASAAGSATRALEEYEAGRYVAAYQIYAGLAGSGDPEAQYYVGLMHVMGQGVPRDPRKGAGWLKRAAEQGYADAASALGNMYASGAGGRLDHAEAIKWLEMAAELAEQQGLESDCD